MNYQLALEYIRRRMDELGYGDNYTLRLRHLRLDTLVYLELKAYNQWMVLIEPSEEVRVESDTGIFDLSEYLVNELQYEHSGKIIIRNLSNAPNHLRMIQVIPKVKNYGS